MSLENWLVCNSSLTILKRLFSELNPIKQKTRKENEVARFCSGLGKRLCNDL